MGRRLRRGRARAGARQGPQAAGTVARPVRAVAGDRRGHRLLHAAPARRRRRAQRRRHRHLARAWSTCCRPTPPAWAWRSRRRRARRRTCRSRTGRSISFSGTRSCTTSPTSPGRSPRCAASCGPAGSCSSPASRPSAATGSPRSPSARGWRRARLAPGRGAGPPRPHGDPGDGESLEPFVDVHAFVPEDLRAAAVAGGLTDVRVQGEELVANWFGWFNRTVEATAEYDDVPWMWRQYAFRGYLALQTVDRVLLDPGCLRGSSTTSCSPRAGREGARRAGGLDHPRRGRQRPGRHRAVVGPVARPRARPAVLVLRPQRRVRLRRAARPAAAGAAGPRFACLYAGVNDVRGPGFDPAAYERDLHALARGLRERSERVLLCTLPLDLGRPRAAPKPAVANAAVERVAASTGPSVCRLDDLSGMGRAVARRRPSDGGGAARHRRPCGQGARRGRPGPRSSPRDRRPPERLGAISDVPPFGDPGTREGLTERP